MLTSSHNIDISLPRPPDHTLDQVVLLVGLCLMLTLLFSCGSSVHLSIYQTETEWVDLREWPSGYPIITNLSHPADLETTQFRDLLYNMQYRHSELFSSHMGKPHSTFTEYQLTLLASELPKAFRQALPEEVITFRVRNEQTSQLYTKGFCFIHQDEFHLIIQELQQADFTSPVNQTRPPTYHWEFVPRNGQHLPSFHSAHDFPHWIVTPIFKRSSYGI